MNRKQFILLGVAAVVVTVFAWIMGQRESVRHETAASTRLFADLESQLNNITQIVVQQAGESPVTIERQGDRWAVVEKGGYPADVGRLRQALIALAKTETIEPKTRDPAKYAKLGVQAIGATDSESQDVKLFGKDKKQLVHVVVGKSDATGGSYIRKADEAQSWLGSEQISFPAKAEDWLDKNLIKLDNNRIQRVEVELGEGLSYAIDRSDPSQTDFQLEAMPQGKRLKPGQTQRIATALSNLSLTDVVVPQDQNPDDDSVWQRTLYKTFDGLTIKAHTREIEGEHHLKLFVDFDPELVKKQVITKAENESVKEESVKENAKINAKQEAEQLQRRFQGWTFIIPSYKANVLALKRDELIEDSEKSDESKTNEDKGDLSKDNVKSEGK